MHHQTIRGFKRIQQWAQTVFASSCSRGGKQGGRPSDSSHAGRGKDPGKKGGGKGGGPSKGAKGGPKGAADASISSGAAAGTVHCRASLEEFISFREEFVKFSMKIRDVSYSQIIPISEELGGLPTKGWSPMKVTEWREERCFGSVQVPGEASR